MSTRESMNVSLTPELAAFVDRLVAEGGYRSASEVVREGLRELERRERRLLLEKWLVEGLSEEEKRRLPRGVLERAREKMDAKIREGIEELERGEWVEGEAFFGVWKERLRRAEGGETGGGEMGGGERPRRVG